MSRNAAIALKNGQLVRVRLMDSGDEWCEAMVKLVSPNQKSVLLVLLNGGMVRAPGGFLGAVLPLSIDDELQKVTGLLGGEYELEWAAAMSTADDSANPIIL